MQELTELKDNLQARTKTFQVQFLEKNTLLSELETQIKELENKNKNTQIKLLEKNTAIQELQSLNEKLKNQLENYQQKNHGSNEIAEKKIKTLQGIIDDMGRKNHQNQEIQG